jgi:hypothetical protein
MAEEYFSRLRGAEIGIHRHIAGAYVHRHAQEGLWREDNRRTANGDQVSRPLQLETLRFRMQAPEVTLPRMAGCAAQAVRYDENNSTFEFERLLGRAALALWPDLPRNVQESLFEAAVPGDGIIRNQLASYLHDHHPKTAHPTRPTRLA